MKSHKRAYINIPLPVELVNQIDDVTKMAGLGYKTKSEFVKEAVREKILELYNLRSLKKLTKTITNSLKT